MKKLIEMLMEAHKDQKYDGDPYFRHLFAVALEYMKLPNPTANGLTACLFHDFVEDSDFTNQDLVIGGMDWDAIALVDLLTDKPGKNRHERHLNTYPGIAANPEARKIKICDRFVNIRNAWKSGNKKLLAMYRKEHPYFEGTLYKNEDPYSLRQLWAEMANMLYGVKTDGEV